MYKCNGCGEEVEMTDHIHIQTQKCWKDMNIPELLAIDKVLETFREVVKACILTKIAENDDLMGLARNVLGDDPEFMQMLNEAKKYVDSSKDEDEESYEFPDELPQIG